MESSTIASMMDGSTSTDSSVDYLQRGDMLAAEDRWRDAIDMWDRCVQHDPETQPAVAERLDWLLRESATRDSVWANNTFIQTILATIAATLGTFAILIAGDPGSTQANLLAAAAWILYGLSAVLIVVAARGRVRPSYSALLQQARKRVEIATQTTPTEDSTT